MSRGAANAEGSPLADHPSIDEKERAKHQIRVQADVLAHHGFGQTFSTRSAKGRRTMRSMRPGRAGERVVIEDVEADDLLPRFGRSTDEQATAVSVNAANRSRLAAWCALDPLPRRRRPTDKKIEPIREAQNLDERRGLRTHTETGMRPYSPRKCLRALCQILHSLMDGLDRGSGHHAVA